MECWPLLNIFHFSINIERSLSEIGRHLQTFHWVYFWTVLLLLPNYTLNGGSWQYHEVIFVTFLKKAKEGWLEVIFNTSSRFDLNCKIYLSVCKLMNSTEMWPRQKPRYPQFFLQNLCQILLFFPFSFDLIFICAAFRWTERARANKNWSHLTDGKCWLLKLIWEKVEPSSQSSQSSQQFP